MTVFLRSDIYTHIYNAARERDKLDLQRIEWNDPEVLKRVLDERITISHEGRTPDEMWGEVFAPLEHGESVKDYVIKWIRPRPRDAIYFVKCAINEAVSRGHSRVEPQDLESARQIYSDWAFNSLIDEDDPEKSKMKDVIYEFLGEDMVLQRSRIFSMIEKAAGKESTNTYFNLLCESHFLEMEDQRGIFHTIEDEETREKITRIISKSKSADEILFRISRPYWAWFQFENVQD